MHYNKQNNLNVQEYAKLYSEQYVKTKIKGATLWRPKQHAK
jgi:hypothetical protein